MNTVLPKTLDDNPAFVSNFALFWFPEASIMLFSLSAESKDKYMTGSTGTKIRISFRISLIK